MVTEGELPLGSTVAQIGLLPTAPSFAGVVGFLAWRLCGLWEAGQP